MDFRKLLDHLDTISEAGTKAGSFGMYADNPEYADAGEESYAYKELTKNVPKSPTSKPDLDAAPKFDNTTMSGTSDKYSFSAKDVMGSSTGTAGQEAPAVQLSPQQETQKQNLRKKLNDITTQLFNLNTQSIQSGQYEGFKSNIAKALLESFDIFEEPSLSMTGQRAKLTAELNDIIKQLEPYKNDPVVAQDIAQAQRSMQAPVKPAPLNIPTGDNQAQQPAQTGTSAQQKPAQAGSAAQQKPATGKGNDQIKKLQTALQANGYNIGSHGVDGFIGKDTKKAMQQAGISGSSDADIAKIKKAGATGTASQQKPTQSPIMKPAQSPFAAKPAAPGSMAANIDSAIKANDKATIDKYVIRDNKTKQIVPNLSDAQKLAVINSPSGNNGTMYASAEKATAAAAQAAAKPVAPPAKQQKSTDSGVPGFDAAMNAGKPRR